MRKISSFSLSFATFLGLETVIGCTSQGLPPEQVRAEREANYVEGIDNVQWTPVLEVNKTQGLSGKKGDTQEGMKDLKNLVNTAETAGAWLELPRTHHWISIRGRPSEYNLADWISYHGESIMVPGGVKINYTMFSSILNKNKIQLTETRMWHLRPQSTLTNVYNAALKTLMKEEVNPQQLDFSLTITGAFPLPEEFYLMLNRALDTRSIDSRIQYSEALCSPAGIVIITPTEDGKDLVASLTPEDLVQQLRAVWKTSAKHIPQLPQYVRNNTQECASYKKRTVQEFCKRLTNKYVIFEYRSY